MPFLFIYFVGCAICVCGEVSFLGALYESSLLERINFSICGVENKTSFLTEVEYQSWLSLNYTAMCFWIQNSNLKSIRYVSRSML